jgi:two-component system phosphate regulon response regulator PhoB
MMSSGKILIVEDDDDILALVKYNLDKAGYKTSGVSTGDMALKKVISDPPDLVVLDLMLPGLDGLEVCKDLRSNPVTRRIPIVMLTARGEEVDVVAGLDVGADDYVTKPFSPRILLAKIRAILRRCGASDSNEQEQLIIKRDEIEIDVDRHSVYVKSERVELTRTEFSLLRFLAQRPGVVFTRYQLVDAVHGKGYPVTDRSIDVQIVGLREKLKSSGEYIETIRGVGYRFKDSRV